MFKLWVDDLRTPPDDSWHWCKSVHETKINFCQLGGLNGKKGIVSLDHDAGSLAYMGGDFIQFLKWLEEKRYEDSKSFDNISFHLHTWNVVGRDNMRAIIKRNRWKEIYDGF